MQYIHGMTFVTPLLQVVDNPLVLRVRILDCCEVQKAQNIRLLRLVRLLLFNRYIHTYIVMLVPRYHINLVCKPSVYMHYFYLHQYIHTYIHVASGFDASFRAWLWAW